MLAIIIPYYKLTFFEATLDSLANQVDKRFNVYIGNDASSEDPEKLLEQYEGKFNFKYHRFESNLGGISLTKQWERCIALSNNEPWIQILGDDDVLYKNYVSSFFNNIEEINKLDCNVVRFASRYINEKGGLLKGGTDFFHPKIEKATNSYYRHYKGESRSSLSEYIFKRESYTTFKFYNFPLAWHSDDKAWLDFSNCGTIFTINVSIVEVRLSSNNISGRNDNYNLKNKARYLFFKELIDNKLIYFNRSQKIELLLEYGIIIKKQKKIHFKNTFYITYQLLKLGALISLLKFIRRIFIAKFKFKNE